VVFSEKWQLTHMRAHTLFE